jgi:hypothetical protein
LIIAIPFVIVIVIVIAIAIAIAIAIPIEIRLIQTSKRDVKPTLHVVILSMPIVAFLQNNAYKTVSSLMSTFDHDWATLIIIQAACYSAKNFPFHVLGFLWFL